MEKESSATVGIIANPASARDVRRIVAFGGALTTHDKLNMLARLMAGLGVGGVGDVISMADRSGIMVGLRRLAARPSAADWPALRFVEQPITHTEADTRQATRAMVDAGVGAIVVLGGDGTNRVVASASGAVPVVSISTGTNNAFPRAVEPTVAGIAAALVATDAACRAAATYRAKTLTVACGRRTEHALVDVAISRGDSVGSGAVWDTTLLSELFLSFAEADAIGLSAIGGHLRPTSRTSPEGLAMALGTPGTVVAPPIGPGLVQPVAVRSVRRLAVDQPVEVLTAGGVIALDGERMFRFGADETAQITLRADGPLVVDVAAALNHAAANGLLASASADGDDSPPPHQPFSPNPPEAEAEGEATCSHPIGSTSTPRWSGSVNTSPGSCRSTTPTRRPPGTSAPG
ncbi:MAG: NAD(+)/NADH kinase [Actinomycetota bacterium]